MGSGQELDSWMYSQITLAVDQLNSVHDTMDGNDGIKESVNEGSLYSSQQLIQKLTPKIEKDVELLKKQFPNYDITLVKNRYETNGSYTLSISGKNTSTIDNNKLQNAIKSKIKESINELTYHEKQIRDGNPNNVFYVFYKGQFEAIYSAMGPRGLFDMYWDKFKVRRPAGSKFKLNPEFVIVPKKEYDNSTSNHYAKLKPYVDKFWDKLQNESTKEEWAGLDTIKRGGYGSPTLQNGDKVRMVIDARKNKYYNGVINGSSIKWEDGAKSELSLATQMSNRGDLQVLRPTNKNESVNEGTEPEVITQIKTIAKNHQHDVIVDPKSGKKMKVDAFSASAIATVYDALSSSSKEKFLTSGLLGMQQMAMKLLKK